jgi:bifunctional non-homologous end joining protein LigD
MLAFPAEPFDSKEWIFEVKFDGTRTIAYVDCEGKEVRFLNRRMSYFQFRYPELKDIWKLCDAKKIILDGEIVIFEKGKPNFYKLAEREHVDEKTRIEILSELIPATYVVFDVLHLDGKDLVNLPLIERKRILNAKVEESDKLLISVFVEEKGKEFFEKAKAKGLEGIMAKKINSVYEIGKRSKNWLKIKALKTIDTVIIGYTTGTGVREELGSLIVGAYYKNKIRYLGKVGTGFSEEELKEILSKLQKIRTGKCCIKTFDESELKLPPERKAIWVKPKYVCEVKFMEFTKDLRLRAPAFVRTRADKLPKECKLEDELIS